MKTNIIKNSASFNFKENNYITLEKIDMKALKTAVNESELKRFRYCLHYSEKDLIQEMIIGFQKGSEVPIHRHKNKTESFHIIEGVLDIVFYDNKEKENNRIRLGDINSGFPFIYRLSKELWHTVEIISDYAVIHEITTGPFNKNEMEILNNGREQ